MAADQAAEVSAVLSGGYDVGGGVRHDAEAGERGQKEQGKRDEEGTNDRLQRRSRPASPPPSSPTSQCLARILNDTDVSDSINKSNADHGVLFEAISCIIVSGPSCDPSLQTAALRLLGKFIGVKEPNIRYLGLNAMARLAGLHNEANKEEIKKQQQVVVHSLKDADIR